jgi:hypothetical protein
VLAQAGPPEPFERLANSATVFRLVTLNNSFVPEGARFPVGAAFYPSSSDKAEAKNRNRPVTVSAWDRSRTTAEQARAFRPGTPCEPYILDVQRVRAVHECIDVVADPHANTELSGWEGHSGIVGLESSRYSDKNEWRAVMERLARCSRDYE